jgi:hypothetical protein
MQSMSLDGDKLILAGYTNRINTEDDAVVIKYSGPIGIINYSNEIPNGFELSQNYPNPFNPNTVFKFKVPYESNVRLVVYDVNGKNIETLVEENFKAGVYEYQWVGTKYSSGVYFYNLSTDNYSETKKMILLK